MGIERLEQGCYRIAGELDAAGARELVAACGRLDPAPAGGFDLDLAGLELESGTACALAVDAVRVLLERSAPVVLRHAPQSLAHVLYRVGLLPRVQLVAPRTEEPTSS